MSAPLALLSRLFLDRRICADCISTTMAIPTTEVESLVTTLERHVVVRTSTGRCRACGTSALVYWLYTKNNAEAD